MAKISAVIEGLKILAKHCADGAETDAVEAIHDVLIAGPDVDEDALPEADQADLKRLGWHYNEENRSWAMFV